MSEGMIIRRGGGASLKATDALLRVQAPAGSTVTITKGTTTKTDHGHENADDNSVYDYYFIIHASQFDSVNPWTVTATDGVYTATDTVIINAADEYDVFMQYLLMLYNLGDECSAVTGGWGNSGYSAAGGTTIVNATKNAASVTFSGAASNKICLFATANKITFSGYSTIKANITANGGASFALLLSSNKSSYSSPQNTLANTTNSGTGEISLSLEGLTDGYVALYIYNTSATVTVDKVWLEP